MKCNYDCFFTVMVEAKSRSCVSIRKDRKRDLDDNRNTDIQKSSISGAAT